MPTTFAPRSVQLRVGDFAELKPEYYAWQTLDSALREFTVPGYFTTWSRDSPGSEVFGRLYCVDAQAGVVYALYHVWLYRGKTVPVWEICLHRLQGEGILNGAVHHAFRSRFCVAGGPAAHPLGQPPEPLPEFPTLSDEDCHVGRTRKQEEETRKRVWENLWSMASAAFVDVSVQGFRAVCRYAFDKKTQHFVRNKTATIQKVARDASGERQRLALLCLYHLGVSVPETTTCRCEPSEFRRLTGRRVRRPRAPARRVVTKTGAPE